MRLLQQPILEIWHSRSLILQFALRDIEGQHKGSRLGLSWIVLSPVFSFAIYSFVFVFVFKGSYASSDHSTPAEYACGIFLGLAVVQIFLDCLCAAPTCIQRFSGLVKKTVFPLEVIPLSLVVSSLIKGAVSLSLSLVAILILNANLPMHWAYAFPIFFGFICFTTGATLLFSIFGVIFRDLSQITALLSLLIMFGSAVFYTIDQIPTTMIWITWSPVLISVDSLRNIFIFNENPNLVQSIYLLLLGVSFFALSLALFRKIKPSIADLL